MGHQVIVIRNPEVGSFRKESGDMIKNIEKESDEKKKEKIRKTLEGYKEVWNNSQIQKAYLVDDDVISMVREKNLMRKM